MFIILGSTAPLELTLLSEPAGQVLIISPLTILVDGSEGFALLSLVPADEGPGVGEGDLLLIVSSECDSEVLGRAELEQPFMADSVMSFSMPLVRLVQGRFEGGDLAGERRAAKFSDRNNVISEMNSSLVRKVQFLINSPVPGSITPIKGDERQL